MIDLAALAARYLAPLILSGIAAGVIGKYVYDYAVRYFKAVDKSKVGWDWKGFLLTAVVSFVIAILLYGLVFERVRVMGEALLFSARPFKSASFPSPSSWSWGSDSPSEPEDIHLFLSGA